jgi:zinc/manganese transport system permease protein
MIEVIQFMLPAFLMCLVLVGIHGYFGIHVISRVVIFVDISLAQMAALGAAIGFFFHLGLESFQAYILSIIFTFIGAVLLAGARRLRGRVPEEAFIGVLYAVAAALVILVLQKTPKGGEHIQDLMIGHLLWVHGNEIVLDALVYAAIGILLLFLHRKLYQISTDPEMARAGGMRIFLYDLIFYTLFGIVVTFSVRVAGVLLVFGLLVVPAVIGVMFAKNFLSRLIIAYSAGTLLSMVGCITSYVWDMPTGATVVITLGLALFLMIPINLMLGLRGKNEA